LAGGPVVHLGRQGNGQSLSMKSFQGERPETESKKVRAHGVGHRWANERGLRKKKSALSVLKKGNGNRVQRN